MFARGPDVCPVSAPIPPTANAAPEAFPTPPLYPPLGLSSLSLSSLSPPAPTGTTVVSPTLSLSCGVL